MPLWKLRGWLALDEASGYLSKAMQSTVSDADIVRLSLDGHLQLSLQVPVGTQVKAFLAGPDGETREGITKIDGVWDLWRDADTRRQLEHEYHFRLNRHYISISGIGGASVFSGAYRFRMDPTNDGFASVRSAFAAGSVLAVRVAALNAFAAAHKPPGPEPTELTDDTRLGQRERATLLTIIAALCAEAEIDTTKSSAAAAAIGAMTQRLGAPVAARTIEDHLKRIPDALERKRRR